MIRVHDARFVTTAVSEGGYPSGDLPEIAFVGRSNVGKSSMINALAHRRKLVRVSNTPGRTRTLNFFDVDLEANGSKVTVRLADLPGYGYARVSKAELEAWEGMITHYVLHRAQLRVVVQIVDAEVGPTADDARTLSYLTSSRARLLVVATKLDRLPKARKKPSLARAAQGLGVPRDAVIGFSAKEGAGVDEVWQALLESV